MRALLVALALATPASAEWLSVGPDGGTVTAIAAATSERMLLAGTAEGLLFRSRDKGTTWERVGTRLGGHEVRQIVINPHDAARVWVSTDEGIYRSSDRGSTFLQRLANPKVVQFAVAPANPEVVYAATQETVLQSIDGGIAWTRPASQGLNVTPHSIAVDAYGNVITGQNLPHVNSFVSFHDMVYAGTDAGVFMSADGVTWTDAGLPAYVTQLAAADAVVAATYGRGVFIQHLGRTRATRP